MQVSEALHRYGASLGAAGAAGLRRPADRPAAARPPSAAWTSSSRRPVAPSTTSRAARLRLDHVEMVILDEADEMLDMGFAEDLEVILPDAGRSRQTALFSATISPAIAGIARRHLREPERVRVRAERSAPPARRSPRSARSPTSSAARTSWPRSAGSWTWRIPPPRSCSGGPGARWTSSPSASSARGHDAAALHGGMSQEQRDRVMGRFRDGVAGRARGHGRRRARPGHRPRLARRQLRRPVDTDEYVHRIGRTGRAGREGVAITLLEPREHRLLREHRAATRRAPGAGQGAHRGGPARAPARGLRGRASASTAPGNDDGDEGGAEAGTKAAPMARGGGDGAGPGAADLDRYRAVVEALADEYARWRSPWLPSPSSTRARGGRRVGGGDRAGVPAAGPVSEARAPVRRNDPGAAPGRDPAAPPWRRPRPGTPGRPLGSATAASGHRPGRRMGAACSSAAAGGRGMRPGDLVGAITAEAGVPGSAIGAIQITDSFSLVDVADEVVEQVVRALRSATIRGRTFAVRLDRDVR